jgi:Protein of unknown function (DUF2878)
VNKTLNLISFKIGWDLCIWAAIQHQAMLSWLAGCALVTINISVQKKRRISLAKVVCVLALGFSFETLNAHLGFYTFPNHYSFLPPSWLMAFWPAFSLLFIEFMDVFDTKPFWFHLLVGVTGALGYYCGEWINLIHFREPVSYSLGFFCAVWALEYLVIVKTTSLVGRKAFQ